jgi:hypothetical protein
MHGDRAQILSTLSRQIPVDIIPQSATYEQVKQVLSESNFSLNLSMNAPANRRELKGRVIEIPAHCILLSESTPELETYYNEDEFILFNSVEEAIEKVKSLDDKQVVDLFRRGNKALWERNTAYHEWNKILPLMDPDFKEVDVNKLIYQYHSEFIHYEH